MIPNHPRFIEAINEKNKVWVKFYSTADSGALDHVCAPLDYGPGSELLDGLHRYWLWDYTGTPESHTLSLGPQQIVELQVLGETFDPTEFDVSPFPWAIPRNWASSPAPSTTP